MKYVDDYRDAGLARALAARIRREALAGRRYHFMEFCGGHTHVIARYGIEDLVGGTVRLVHGPGCPVCVLPMARLDMAIRLAHRPEVTLCTYADLLRVPASGGTSLLQAKAAGADIRMVYSVLDALHIAEAEPDREIVFFAIGFETTTPPTALAIRLAARRKFPNFSVFCNHVLTPAAIQCMFASPAPQTLGPVRLDGIIGPAHVSTIIGSEPFEFFARQFRMPVVVSGFEPLDVMQSILMLVRQVNRGGHGVENQYGRAVRRHGNEAAKAQIMEVFEPRESFEWRGLGVLPRSGLRIKDDYAGFDAERRFDMEAIPARDNPACECGAVLCGLKTPAECKLFGTRCTPDTPLGACMVSSEGACAAHWTYGRFRARRVS